MLPRVVSLALLCALAAPAGGRTVSTGGTERVAKPETRLGPMHWANLMDADHVQIWPQPQHVTLGTRFDIVDERGLVGRVVVEAIDEQDSGCGVMYEVATAKWINRPSRQLEGQVFAVGTAPITTPRARVITSYEAKTMPPVPAGDAETTMAVDLDGDKDPELAMVYYYDCAIEGERVVRARRNGNSCVQTWARLQKKWRVIHSGVIDPCF